MFIKQKERIHFQRTESPIVLANRLAPRVYVCVVRKAPLGTKPSKIRPLGKFRSRLLDRAEECAYGRTKLIVGYQDEDRSIISMNYLQTLRDANFKASLVLGRGTRCEQVEYPWDIRFEPLLLNNAMYDVSDLGMVQHREGCQVRSLGSAFHSLTGTNILLSHFF